MTLTDPRPAGSTSSDVAPTRLAGRGRKKWKNWAGSVTASPERVLRPESVEELQQAVVDSPRHWKIRMAGSGHSFTPIVPSDHLLLLPCDFGEELGIDSQRMTARIPAGMVLHEVNLRLAAAGYALANMGDITALCERVLLIHQGQLFHDGALEALTNRLAPCREVRLELRRPAAAEALAGFGTVQRQQGHQVQLLIAREQVTERVAALLERFEVVDLEVRDPPIEELIRPRTMGEHNIPEEIWLIKINPTERATVPVKPGEIIDRRNQLEGNISLFQQLSHLEMINDMILDDAFRPEYLARFDIKAPIRIPKSFAGDRDKPYHIPCIEMPRDVQDRLDFEGKIDRGPANIGSLIAEGERAALEFLRRRAAVVSAPALVRQDAP